MKFLINRKPIDGPWGGGNNFVSAICSHLKEEGHDVTHKIENGIDCFLVVDPRPDSDCPGLGAILEKKEKFPNSKIVQRINECDARKNTEHMDMMLLQCSQFIDKTVFVSNWMQNYFLTKGWVCKNNTVIHNGVDKNIFKGKNSEDSIISVVAHHWSNNLLKGFDAYEFLDYLAGKNLIRFTYVGRHRGTFKNTKCIDPCVGVELAQCLSGHSVYVSGSRFDPGPNHVLEAISVGLPTYVHKDGGGAVEFAGHTHTFGNLSDLEDLILSNNYTKNEYIPMSWKECTSSYIKELGI